MALQYEWYLRNAGAKIAEKYLAGVDAAIRQIAAQPGLGTKRNFRSAELQGMRSFSARGAFRKHLVFHRVTDHLSIERVMHGARDLPHRLMQEPGMD